jgi:type III pantothenate kinase
MLLAVDVGNTQTAVGLFSGKDLAASWRFATDVRRTGDEIATLLDSLLRLDGFSRDSVSGIAVASVVPRLSGEYSTMATAKFGLEALVVGPGVKTGMPILTSDPRQVGPDLIVDAVAAFEAYGGPCIAVDFGTATTFSAVSAVGEYLGHAIAPGIEISLDALATRAARLVKIELADPGSVIGKNTVHAMQARPLYGFAGRVTARRAHAGGTGGSAVTVATGGLAFLSGHATTLDELDPLLTPVVGDHLPPEPSRMVPTAADTPPVVGGCRAGALLHLPRRLGLIPNRWCWLPWPAHHRLPPSPQDPWSRTVTTEMVSATALPWQQAHRGLFRFREERPVAVQLFGDAEVKGPRPPRSSRDPRGEAVPTCLTSTWGCPVRKVMERRRSCAAC